jgi:hypothetical protein
LKLNDLNLDGGSGAARKGDLKMKVSMQKLLKTNVEKMSLFGSEQKLLKTK